MTLFYGSVHAESHSDSCENIILKYSFNYVKGIFYTFKLNVLAQTIIKFIMVHAVIMEKRLNKIHKF